MVGSPPPAPRTGARTPQAMKRVRQAATRHEVLQPRRSAAKTFVSKAVTLAQSGDAEGAGVALLEALSALDRAAKVGAIHANAAARRKSRLTLKVNAALGGATLVGGAKATRATGRAATAKAAKARIAAGKATKAKGEQTAAGKARAALSRSSREAKAANVCSAEARDDRGRARLVSQGCFGRDHRRRRLPPRRPPRRPRREGIDDQGSRQEGLGVQSGSKGLHGKGYDQRKKAATSTKASPAKS